MKKIIALLLVFGIAIIGSIQLISQETEEINIGGMKTTKPYMRFKHFEEMRSYPTNEVFASKRINAIKSADKMMLNVNKKVLTQAQQNEWRPIGPFDIGGRVKSIAIHPTEPGVVYIGAAAGGIWKTTDNGANWKPIFDYENGIGFGSLCIDVNNPNTIYAGTGEAVLNSAAPIYLSAGVYKSIDAGETWFPTGLSDAGSFSKIFVHPLNSNRVVGGVVGNNKGFYYSADAGRHWIKSENFDKNVTDVTFNPADENEYFAGVMGEGVYHTTNSGQTWEKSSAGLPSSINRISVQMAPSNPDILYALMEEAGIGTIFKSINRGASWTRSFKGQESFFNGQGWYDNYIMVHPTDPNTVFAGGIDVWKTSNGGQNNGSWMNMTNGYNGGSVHVDQHCGAFNPQNPANIWIGNDGGVYMTFNSGSSWTDMNHGLEITQFYSLDIDQSVDNRTFGGSQDNGTLGNPDNPIQWGLVYGGDGFQTVLDFEDKNTIYGEVYTSNTVIPFRRNLKTGANKILSRGLADPAGAGIWDAPLIMHPLYSFALYHGRNSVYWSFDNGDNWSEGIKSQMNKFTAIAVSPIKETMVWAGDIGGGLFMTKDHFETIKDVSSNGLVARSITCIVPSHQDTNIAFVTISGFGTDHIYKTTNAGDSWQSVSTAFPDIPCNYMIAHPENMDWLFVGTDIGVFATFNGGQTWLPFGRKLPRTIITGMKILNNTLNGNYRLRVSTFGRSMWEIDLPIDVITDREITSPAGGELLVGTSKVNFSWYGFAKPVRLEISYDGVVWSTLSESTESDFYTFDVPNKISYKCRIKVTSLVADAQMKISNTFSINAISKGSLIQTSSFNHVPYGLALDGEGNLWSTSFYNNKLYKINKTTLRVENSIVLPGDSLYTDLTIDKNDGRVFAHRMNSSGSTGTGGKIVVTDKNGNLIMEYKTPAENYPIGLEFVDNDLIVCDRDGFPKYIYVTEPLTGRLWTKHENPFKDNLGPRSICYDGQQYLYQASTSFPGDALTASYIVKIDKNDLSNEVDRMPLLSRSGAINCRGIEYDRIDKNFWVTDFGGNIYKIAGFETVATIAGTEDYPEINNFKSEIFPNPLSEFSNITIDSFDSDGLLEISINDVIGRSIIKLNKLLTKDEHSAYFQISGEKFSQGIYYAVFYLNGKIVDNKQIVVIK